MPFPRFAVTGPVPCDALVLTHPRMCSAPSIAQATIPASPFQPQEGLQGCKTKWLPASILTDHRSSRYTAAGWSSPMPRSPTSPSPSRAIRSSPIWPFVIAITLIFRGHKLRRINSEIPTLQLAMYINHPGHFNTSSPSATPPTQSVGQAAERHPYPICIYTRCLSPRSSLSPSSIYQKTPLSNQPRGNISENNLRCGPPSVVYTSTTRRVDFPLRLNQEGPHLKGSR